MSNICLTTTQEYKDATFEGKEIFLDKEARIELKRSFSIFDWDWFITLTFAPPSPIPNPPSSSVASTIPFPVIPTSVRMRKEHAARMIMKWLHLMNRKLYGRRYYKRGIKGVGYLYTLEEHASGEIHIHALVSGVHLLERREWHRKWVSLGGGKISLIEEYNPQEKGEDYVLKTVWKDGEYEFGGALNRR